MTSTIEQAMKAKADKLVQAIVFQAKQGVSFDFACGLVKETTVFRGEQWETIVNRAKAEMNPDFATMIEKQFSHLFRNVKEWGEHWTGNGTRYFYATCVMFDDAIEMRMSADGTLYSRMVLVDADGVAFDNDFELEGVTGLYELCGTVKF